MQQRADFLPGAIVLPLCYLVLYKKYLFSSYSPVLSCLGMSLVASNRKPTLQQLKQMQVYFSHITRFWI